MAWSDAARKAAAEARKRFKRAKASAVSLSSTPEGLNKLHKLFKHRTRYQLASMLAGTRRGEYAPNVATRAIKSAAAAQAYRRAMRLRGSSSTGAVSSAASFLLRS